MTTPETLYDIQPLPLFAFEPSVLLWAISLSLPLGVLLLFFFKSKYFDIQKPPLLQKLSLALRELQQLQEYAQDDRELSDRASLITRRLIGHFVDTPAHSLTLAELNELSMSLPEKLTPLFRPLVVLEETRYRGGAADTRKIVNELIDAVKVLQQEPPQKLINQEEGHVSHS
ncbi:MAG: hypothetical protein KDD55_04485 [Bdellovibrionales bacterium]|nr:hypothetical protein [Bdellovibrionales bacterium]